MTPFTNEGETPYCGSCQRPHGNEPSIRLSDGSVCCVRCAGFVGDPWAPLRASAVSANLLGAGLVDLSGIPKPPGNPMLSGRMLRIHTLVSIGFCTQQEYDRVIHPHSKDIPEPTGRWLGALKDRIEVTARCERVIDLGVGEFGPSFRAILRTAENDIVTWRSGDTLWMHEGVEYTFKGTVAYHDVYNGVRQTALSRCSDNAAPKKTRKKKRETE